LPLRGRLEAPVGGDLAVASQVPGRVVSLEVAEGQAVDAGTLLATVDDVASRDGVRQAQAALAQTHADAARARTLLGRAKALVAKGIAATQELDDAIAQSRTADASVRSATAAADLARHTLGRVQVRAPIAGVVTHVWRGPGALVDGTAATPLVQLASAVQPEFVADATERDLSRLQVALPVAGTLVDGERWQGHIRLVTRALEPGTGLGIVRLALDAVPRAPLGSSGHAQVTLRRRGAVLLPVSAVRGAVQNGVEVAVCHQGHAQLRTLTIGWRDDRDVEVTGGLGPGETVALDHALGLQDGTLIEEAR
jgi:RND family efflux transporter MFP subunit